MTPADRDAWGDFWKRNADNARPGGCLPQGATLLEQAQKSAWMRFVRGTAKGARVLDLATGDARVLRWFGNARPDLKLFGIDSAPALPKPPKGCKVRVGVSMEELPFTHASFQLVTSQFGFEYGDIAATTRQIARVLAPGGRAGLMVHRGDGPILAHNLLRRRAIEWVVEEQDVLTVAGQVLAFPAAAPLIANRIAQIAADGAHLFGASSPAWEIAEAARRALGLELRGGAASLAGTLANLKKQAAHEAERIASLQRACAVADDRERLLQTFAVHGLATRSTTPVTGPEGRPFADLIELDVPA